MNTAHMFQLLTPSPPPPPRKSAQFSTPFPQNTCLKQRFVFFPPFVPPQMILPNQPTSSPSSLVSLPSTFYDPTGFQSLPVASSSQRYSNVPSVYMTSHMPIQQFEPPRPSNLLSFVPSQPVNRKRSFEESITQVHGHEEVNITYAPTVEPKRFCHVPNLVGEKRLIVNFESYGSPGRYPQTYGRKGGAIIPTGLAGVHSMYGQPWRFEIVFSDDKVFIKKGFLCCKITWRMTNLINGVTHFEKETEEEAFVRMSLGRTISSRVFRRAMEFRARELEDQMNKLEDTEGNASDRKSLLTKITSLRPKKFSEGTLVFGLQHDSVQTHIFKDG